MSERGTSPETSGRFRLPSGRGGRVAAVLLVGVAYYLGARVGLSLSLVEENVTPLWPPTGVAVAAFLLLGRSTWPGVAVAALAVNLPISNGPVAAAVTAVGNTLAPLLAVALLTRVGFRRQLDRQRDALGIVFLGALVSMLVSAGIGATTLAASGAIAWDDLPGAWAVWWTGDAMGVLVVAPFLLSLPLFWEQPRWSRMRWLEGAAIMVVVAVVSISTAYSEVGVLFLAIPVLGWAAWRLQLRGAAPAALIASIAATWHAVRDNGMFAGVSLLEQMLTLQGFNACVALTSFFLAAMVSERNRTAEQLVAAAAELEERVRRRTAELSAANARLLREMQDRSQAEQQLSQQEERGRREHEIAATLQRSLLPERLPQIPGLAVAARYVPATGDVQVGGDWYDVVPLHDGLVGLVIGDVAGHGLRAAATMGQLRMAVRAYALQDPSPVSVMQGVHRLVSELSVPDMVTLMYLVVDPDTGRVRFANAGHPPALVVGNGAVGYLHDPLAPPIGVTPTGTFTEGSHDLPAGATLLLYTDGLVERRGLSIETGMQRLGAEATAHRDDDVDVLCERLLASLLDSDPVADDTALVAVRPVSMAGRPLTLGLPAESRRLAQVRAPLRRWLRQSGVADEVAAEILVACGEACANVVQHAYGPVAGNLDVHVELSGDTVELTIRDHGRWRPAADRGGGWGLHLMRSLMDTVEVSAVEDGTEVRMCRRVRIAAAT